MSEQIALRQSLPSSPGLGRQGTAPDRMNRIAAQRVDGEVPTEDRRQCRIQHVKAACIGAESWQDQATPVGGETAAGQRAAAGLHSGLRMKMPGNLAGSDPGRRLMAKMKRTRIEHALEGPP